MNKHSMFATISIGLFCCFFSVSVVFGASEVAWSDLTEREQRILKPLEETWNQLPGERRRRLRTGAQRWEKLTPDQRKRAGVRFQHWKKLPEEKKMRIRRRFDYFQNLSTDERKILLLQKSRFNNLPKDRRRELRKQWEKLSPERRSEIREELGIGRKNGSRPRFLENRRKDRSENRIRKNRMDRIEPRDRFR